MRRFIARYAVLGGALRELWVIFGVKVIAILAYAVMNSTLVLWLSSDLGYDDRQAGYIVAAWSALMSFCTVLVGAFTDAVGIRKALLLGMLVCLVSRTVMSLTQEPWAAVTMGLMPLALGEALMTPVMVAAVKRYSTVAQRSMAFAVFYTMMNVGFAAAGALFDAVRTRLGETTLHALPGITTGISTYRILFLLSLGLTLVGGLLVYALLREGVAITGAGAVTRTAPGPRRSLWQACRGAGTDTGRIFKGLWKDTGIYRFLLFLVLVVGVRLIFFHMFYTFPKYAIRELGAGAPIGQLFGVLNAVTVIVLVPIVGALTHNVSSYRMVTVGSAIAAFSVFLVALPAELYTGLAQGWPGYLIGHLWLGIEGELHPLYVAIALFVLVLSIGESLWSPRLYEYTVSVAPEGHEASYMSLSILPFFLAKLGVGALSGLLLSSYCPETGPRSCETMWLIIGVMALATPIGLIAFRRFLKTC
ncbi:MAG: MFS transporter [Gammaproteobacteria bacterium]